MLVAAKCNLAGPPTFIAKIELPYMLSEQWYVGVND